MFRIDFKPDRNEWADATERELLLDTSRIGEIDYSFERYLTIRADNVDLSTTHRTPVFGLAFELGYSLGQVQFGDIEVWELDVDSWPMDMKLDGDNVCLTTYEWYPVPHGRQEPNESDLYAIGQACVPVSEFCAVIIDLLDRFHAHLRDLYTEARDNAALDSMIESYKHPFQVSTT